MAGHKTPTPLPWDKWFQKSAGLTKSPSIFKSNSLVWKNEVVFMNLLALYILWLRVNNDVIYYSITYITLIAFSSSLLLPPSPLPFFITTSTLLLPFFITTSILPPTLHYYFYPSPTLLYYYFHPFSLLYRFRNDICLHINVFSIMI